MWNQLKQQLERPSRAALAVVTASTLATLLFWLVAPDSLWRESSDYRSYYEPVARSLLDGGGFQQTDGTIAVYYPPGYPVLLAGIFGFCGALGLSETVVYSLFALACMGLSSLCLYFLARSVWGPLPALASPLIWMAYPFFQLLTLQHSKELPYILAIYASVALTWSSLHRSRAWLVYPLIGMLIGFAMLIAPIAIGMGAVW